MGYGVWPASLIEGATRLSVNVHSCVNSSAQFAGIAALEGPQDQVDVMMKAFDERRNVIVKGLNTLPGITCRMPGGAFYAFPNITHTRMDSATIQKRMLEEAGVAVIAGTSFGAYGEGYVRFSYANSIENIETALDRVARLLG
jgi:aspartate aminotransferase